MMVVDALSSEMWRPSTLAWPPKRVCQRLYESKATWGACGRSSSRVKLRPMMGWTPNKGKNVDSTWAQARRAGLVSVRSQSWSPGNMDVTAWKAGILPAPIEIVEPKLKFTFFDGRFHSVGDDAAGIGVRQGTKEHAIDDGENGGGCADSERQDQ